MRGSLELALFLAQGVEQKQANWIVRCRKTGDPFRHDLHIAKIAQAAEKGLAQLLHLLPCRIRIDGQEAVRHRAATADGDPEIVHGIGRKFKAGLVTLLQHALRPVGESGFVVVCDEAKA